MEAKWSDPTQVVEAIQEQLMAGRLTLPEDLVQRLIALLEVAESRARGVGSEIQRKVECLRVLLIGFDAESATGVRGTLEAAQETRFLLRFAPNFESVPELVASERFDLAVLDLSDQRSGTALLARADVVTRGLPLVGVVGSAEEAQALRNAGCASLLRSEFSIQRASTILIDAFLDHRVESALEKQEKDSHFATRDALTGLPNRSSFRGQLEIAIHYAERHEEHVSVLFVDIDRFAAINERLGEEVGDGLIITLSERMARLARKSDLIARVGDDEFALMLQGRDLDFAPARTAERLLECFSQAFVADGEDHSLSASIGIATYPRDATEAETLVRNAASAAYQAKAEGRNTYRFYGQAMTALEARRMAIAHRLRGALARNQFRVHYQPRVDGRDGRILGAEALLRWTDRELGSVSPAEFVPIAERMGLMGEIGAWVMNEACVAHAGWAAAGFADLVLSVNVSAHQVESASLRDAVVKSLMSAGISPGLLEIELTESALVDNEVRAAQLLNEFAEVGVSLALDDFGTGYSSLAYLRQFPVSTLKLDPTFVRAIRADQPFPPFVEAILALADSLDLAVVAEGVETRDQRDALLERNCRWMQGFLFSRPVANAEFLELLRAGSIQPTDLD